MAHDAQGRRSDDLIEFKPEERLEPAPEEKVRLVEHHPWDEYRAKNSDDSRADGSIRDDDGDQPCEEGEYKLDSVGAKKSVRLRK